MLGSGNKLRQRLQVAKNRWLYLTPTCPMLAAIDRGWRSAQSPYCITRRVSQTNRSGSRNGVAAPPPAGSPPAGWRARPALVPAIAWSSTLTALQGTQQSIGCGAQIRTSTQPAPRRLRYRKLGAERAGHRPSVDSAGWAPHPPNIYNIPDFSNGYALIYS
jgi:hypothetical protein